MTVKEQTIKPLPVARPETNIDKAERLVGGRVFAFFVELPAVLAFSAYQAGKIFIKFCISLEATPLVCACVLDTEDPIKELCTHHLNTVTFKGVAQEVFGFGYLIGLISTVALNVLLGKSKGESFTKNMQDAYEVADGKYCDPQTSLLETLEKLGTKTVENHESALKIDIFDDPEA